MTEKEFLNSALWKSLARQYELTEEDFYYLLSQRRALQEALDGPLRHRGPTVRGEAVLEFRRAWLERCGVHDWHIRKEAKAFEMEDIMKSLDFGSKDKKTQDCLFVATVVCGLVLGEGVGA